MDQKSGKPNQKRRAILQGSLAAPVVLTVSSPSAAMVSSHMKCMAGVNQQPGKFFESGEKADTWLRKEIPVEQFKHGNDLEWFYKDPKQGYLNVKDLSTLPNGWQKVDLINPGKRWALVWVDRTSGAHYSLIQVQQPTSQYQFTTQSCNASVNPTIK